MRTESRHPTTTPWLAVMAGAAFFITCGFAADESAAPVPLMVTPGKQLVTKNFENEGDVDKESMGFRKLTQYRVEDGFLKVIPPVIALAGKENDNRWAGSSMARAGLVNLPVDYVCQFRWKYNPSEDPKYQKKASAYIDLGHRCIRVTFSMQGTKLILENHLLGKDAEAPKLLSEAPDLKLEPGKWYDITIEVKGDEVIYQIDGHVLYGKDDFIARERTNTFNIDSGGAGYVLDRVEVWEAGDSVADWETKRRSLSK